MGPIGYPGTSVRIYRYSLRNDTEERSSQLLRGGSLKSRIILMYLEGNMQLKNGVQLTYVSATHCNL